MLRAVAYDERSRQLRVRFASGALYRYYAVPPDIFQALLDPPDHSHDRFFTRAVATRFLEISKGRLVEVEDAEEFFDSWVD